MPLNPNGKIDKPKLPFPDTPDLLVKSNRGHATSSTGFTPTEKKLHDIWTVLLPSVSATISSDDNFYDLGGHSILATRLIFEIRKTFVVNAPLGLVFEQPTIRGQAQAIDNLRNADLGLSWNGNGAIKSSSEKPSNAVPYGDDLTRLTSKLSPSYRPLPSDTLSQPVTVFLTGATGFLGASIVRDLLSRSTQVKRVICLVRASDNASAMTRLKQSLADRGLWNDQWSTQSCLSTVAGDLDKENFGLGDFWSTLANEVDVIIHNGAWVCTLLSLKKKNFFFLVHS